MPSILGTGQLHKDVPGVMEGTVKMEVRGEFLAFLSDPTQDNGIWYATLRIGRDKARVMRGYDNDPLSPLMWGGFINIEGYTHRVTIDPDTWVVTLFDTKQRIAPSCPPSPQTTAGG